MKLDTPGLKLLLKTFRHMQATWADALRQHGTDDIGSTEETILYLCKASPVSIMFNYPEVSNVRILCTGRYGDVLLVN